MNDLWLYVGLALVLLGLVAMLAAFWFSDELERWLKRYGRK